MRKSEPAASSNEIESLIAGLKDEYQQCSLSSVDRAMLDFSVKLTKTPQAVTSHDAKALFDVGFNDLAIHDLVCCVSYFAFVNRIADGLGVELEV